MLKFKARKTDAGARADIVVAKKLNKFSRSSLQQLFARGFAKINGKPAKAGQRLKPGEEIEVDTSHLTKPAPRVEMPVMYEDQDVLVINKPAGVLTHSKGTLNEEATVASFIQPKLNKELTGNRAGIVHRLDRVTSGIIITAKNAAALKYLQNQFSGRKVQKTYLAIVEGVPEPKAALIDAPIGRNPKNPKTFKVTTSGKPAQTEYRIKRTLNKDGSQYGLVEVQPLTGRTHQIRVHMAYIGHPIAGDVVYGKETDGPVYLHASTLGLTLPSGQRKLFKAPTPKIFEQFENE